MHSFSWLIGRRDLLAYGATILGAGSGFIPWEAIAQVREGNFHIGLLMPFSRATTSPLIDPLIDELGKLGYAEGRNTTIDLISAEGEIERLPVLADELVAKRPQVIFSTGAPATLALKKLPRISL